MGSLGLDLSACAAKTRRAAEVLATLDAEARASIHNSHPVALIRSFDPDTGWLSIKVRAVPRELRLSVILGEYIHDLRSALDYTVTALVHASGATLTRRHQFPIHTDRSKFAKNVGTAAAPDDNGPLAHVRHGFDMIESYQPYNTKPCPGDSLLWLLQRLSNSDKHRAVVPYSPMPVSQQLTINSDGEVIDSWQPAGPQMWEPYGEVEILRLRFAEPYPTKIEPDSVVGISLMFIDAAFPPDHPDPIAFVVEDLHALGKQVAIIIADLETL